MKIVFELGWALKSPAEKSFRSGECRALFADYAARLAKFSHDVSAGVPPRSTEVLESSSVLWLCDSRGEAVTSERLADKLKKLKLGGTRRLTVAIGGADGFSAEEQKRRGAKFTWSFGPATLPHELAAVVAAEQLYRAECILGGLPYHVGH